MISLKNKIITTLIGTTTLGVGGTAIVDNQINPYTDKIDRVEMIQVQDIQDAGEAKVELKKDKPEFRLKKWNGEVDLGLTYNAIKSEGARPLLSKKMEYKDTNQELHAYPLDDGNFEFEVILNEKPKTNIITFTLDNYEDLDFFYQPALTQKEKDEGSERPENVVGSYAVYHKTKANHIVGKTNYATGKFGHIYRPLINDSDGKEVWGDLHIENGILSVTIPQEFLDNAVYPVIVDPTFGHLERGGSASSRDADKMDGVSGTPAGTGSVSKITFYGRGSSNDTYIKGVLVKGSDKTIISNGITNATNINTTTSWNDLTYSTQPDITNQLYYVVGISDNGHYIHYDSGGLADKDWFSDTSNNYSSPTNPTDGAVYSPYNLSFYATYTATAVSRRLILIE